MKLTDISCTNCNNTTAFEHSHNLVECTSCSTTIHMDTPVFHTYEVEPLHDIMEQRAKDKAVTDMQLANMPFIDCSTCFDTDNISDEITEEEYMLWHIKRGTRHSAMKDIRRDFREDFLLRPFYELEIGK